MQEAKKSAGMKESDKLKIKFELTAVSDRQKEFFQILSDAWKPLGVELEASITNDYRYVESISESEADLFVYSWIGDFADPLAFLELFKDGSTLNQTVWKNEKFNDLLKQAAETTDSDTHNKLLSQAETALLDDGVVMPIRHSMSLNAVNTNAVGGWYTNALDIHPYKYLYFKDYKQKIPNVVKLEKKNEISAKN
jgi:oligopeptide transport system substrate-binding protein